MTHEQRRNRGTACDPGLGTTTIDLLQIALVFLFCVNSSAHLRAESVVLSPVADTTLLESAPDFNMGAELHVASGTTGTIGGTPTRNRAVFRFNLAGIPRQAKIQSVTLSLNVVWVPGRDGGGGPVSSTFELHRLLSSWGEGNKLGFRGEFASEGEATWNHRLAPAVNGVAGSRWSVPGTAAGTDFLTISSAAQLIAGTNRYVFGPTSELLGDVENWMADPGSNFGWILISQAETKSKTARRFGSREDPSNAPSLMIEYSLDEPLKIEQVRKSSGDFQFQFAAEAGRSYEVQFRERAVIGSWQTLTNIPALPGNTNILIADPILYPERYYRVGKF